MGFFTSSVIVTERVKTCRNVSHVWFDTHAIVFMLKENWWLLLKEKKLLITKNKDMCKDI